MERRPDRGHTSFLGLLHYIHAYNRFRINDHRIPEGSLTAQPLVTHQLGYRCRHLGSNPRRYAGKGVAIYTRTQQPIPEVANRHVADWSKRIAIVAIKNEPRDFILLIRHQCFLKKARERNVGESHLSGHALLFRGSPNTPQGSPPDRAGLAFAISILRCRRNGRYGCRQFACTPLHAPGYLPCSD
jgi:hypothetical protein